MLLGLCRRGGGLRRNDTEIAADRISGHVGANAVHGPRQTLAAVIQPGEQSAVRDSIQAERNERDAPRLRVCPTVVNEFSNHARM